MLLQQANHTLALNAPKRWNSGGRLLLEKFFSVQNKFRFRKENYKTFEKRFRQKKSLLILALFCDVLIVINNLMT